MAANRVLDLNVPPTAIHCMNEYIAYGANISINERGLRIPEDISLSGHDGLEITKVMTPKLTTIKAPIFSMGEAAAELMLQRIHFGKKKDKQLILFDSTVSIGDSTAGIKE